MPKDGEVIHMLRNRESKQFYYVDNKNRYKPTMEHVNARFVAGKGFEYVGPYSGEMPMPDEIDWNNFGKSDIIKFAKKKYPDLKLDARMRTTEIRQRVLDYEQELYQQHILAGEDKE